MDQSVTLYPDIKEWQKKLEKQKQKVHDFVKKEIKRGSSIAMLDNVDPCILGEMQ